MHENKYLHLPVVDESSGTVLGAVNVMEIIQATAGEQGSTGYGAFTFISALMLLSCLLFFVIAWLFVVVRHLMLVQFCSFFGGGWLMLSVGI